MKLVRAKLVLILFFTSIYCFTQYNIPIAPNIIYPINDYVGVLSESQKETLNQKLIDYSKKTSTEIVVIIDKTLNNDDINYAALQIGESWKIGQKGKDNGIVILIVTQDRKMSIQSGRGAGGAMTDYSSKLIIDNYFIPNIKNGDYYQAINSGTDAIVSVLKGEFNADYKDDSENNGNFIFIIILCVFLFIIFISFLNRNNRNNRGNSNRNNRGGNLLRDIILTSSGTSSWWGGGGFGGSSGGGFGGFGSGGSFGGGGASGNW